MRLQDEEAHRHRGICLGEFRVISAEELRKGDEIPEGFPHLLAFDGYQVVVDPIVHSLGSARSLVLGDLAFMVWEEKVHAASVDVEFAAQVLLAHGGALQVPSRETFSPW